ncbi:hypothetical protein SAMN05428939_1323 [Streptomyces sp. TLI_105]|nr:hypothetical protein SAMN05428939_1323 [Streptomyces sp. TLI_105]
MQQNHERMRSPQRDGRSGRPPRPWQWLVRAAQEEADDVRQVRPPAVCGAGRRVRQAGGQIGRAAEEEDQGEPGEKVQRGHGQGLVVPGRRKPKATVQSSRGDVRPRQRQPAGQERLRGGEGESACAGCSGADGRVGARGEEHCRDSRCGPGGGGVRRRVVQPCGESGAGQGKGDRTGGSALCGRTPSRAVAVECAGDWHDLTIMAEARRFCVRMRHSGGATRCATLRCRSADSSRRPWTTGHSYPWPTCRRLRAPRPAHHPRPCRDGRDATPRQTEHRADRSASAWGLPP